MTSHNKLEPPGDYARQVTPLSCEREPIHIVNRIQPCGTLLVVDAQLKVVQCSTNAVDLLPEGFAAEGGVTKKDMEEAGDVAEREDKQVALLDAIVGSPLEAILQQAAVDQVRFVIRGACSAAKANDAAVSPKNKPSGVTTASLNTNTAAVRTFLFRTQGSLSLGRKSCCVTQSGDHFLLEIEDSETPEVNPVNGAEGEEDTMIFMQSIAHELRKCWSIEEMAGLVCSRIMSETPYDRGMVYRFDQCDDSGEVVYETTRWDARSCCREDSFLGLRFPASDIPRQARELFVSNTLRFVYDVDGKDFHLYPNKVPSAEGEEKYTDLSMCRLRGSSYIHLVRSFVCETCFILLILTLNQCISFRNI